jgi:radical SAM enzyme (TIGR01210 family)
MPQKGRAIRDLNRPAAVWKSKDLLGNRVVSSLTVILRTTGCKWRQCTMCGYSSEGAPATGYELLSQFDHAMQRLFDEKMVKIYTSGSFLDPGEVPEEVREKILNALCEYGIERLVIETRPEYVSLEGVESCLSMIETEFAIGLETSSDLIREKLINKGFSFHDFAQASQLIHDKGGRVKAYLLLKSPLLTEGHAIRDAISSAKAARVYADIISLNLCNVQRNTFVERLWERGEYRPPWLWSALEVLKESPVPIICDPVAAGTKRGPHNCGLCDPVVAEAIRKHSLTQDSGIFGDLDCRCKKAWRKIVLLEEYSFGSPLD